MKQYIYLTWHRHKTASPLPLPSKRFPVPLNHPRLHFTTCMEVICPKAQVIVSGNKKFIRDLFHWLSLSDILLNWDGTPAFNLAVIVILTVDRQFIYYKAVYSGYISRPFQQREFVFKLCEVKAWGIRTLRRIQP